MMETRSCVGINRSLNVPDGLPPDLRLDRKHDQIVLGHDSRSLYTRIHTELPLEAPHLVCHDIDRRDATRRVKSRLNHPCDKGRSHTARADNGDTCLSSDSSP